MHAPPDSASRVNNAPCGRRAATRSAVTPPTRPPKAAAAATRAMSTFAACGSKRSLSIDQNAEIPIAPSMLV